MDRGHDTMTIGLKQCQDGGPTRLGRSSAFTFRK